MYYIIIYLFFRRYQQHTTVILLVCKRSFKIVQHLPMMIHGFEQLLDEEIDDDFLRDAIESIAQYYNSQYPGVSMSYRNEHTMV